MSSPNKGNRRRLDTILDVTGRTLIATGLLMLAFVAYQLWGTGYAESRAQNKLADQFRSQSTTTIANVAPSPTTSVKPIVPQLGDTVGQIEIPTIGLSKLVVAGVGYSQLQKGPGLFSGSPLPGQLGNVAIAGHRTTYGAPFGRLNELKNSDAITITTSSGVYKYITKGSPRIVEATDVAVVKTVDKSLASLTLVTCHPKWTSKQRLIVFATLEKITPALPATIFTPPTDAQEVEQLSQGWFHDTSAWPPVLALALLMAGIWIGAALILRQGRSRWVVYPVTLIVFSPILFIFFGYLTRLLPTNL